MSEIEQPANSNETSDMSLVSQLDSNSEFDEFKSRNLERIDNDGKSPDKLDYYRRLDTSTNRRSGEEGFSRLQKTRTSTACDTSATIPNSTVYFNRTNFIPNLVYEIEKRTRRLGEKHLRLVEAETDPIRMIKKLESHREAKTAVGELSYFKELHTKVYDAKKESIQDFLLNFNNLIAKAEEMDNESWSDSRKKKILLSAVKETHPELVLIDRAQEGRLTFEKAQQMLVEEAALRNEAEIRTNLAPAKVLMAKRNFKTRYDDWQMRNDKLFCLGCGQWGHEKYKCPHKPGEKMCYYCKKICTHISAECPEKRKTNARPSHLKPKATSNSKSTNLVRRPKRKIDEKGRTGPKAKLTKVDSDDDYEYFAASANVENEEDRSTGKNLHINFIADSGANEHLVNRANYLSNFSDLPRPKRVMCANSNSNS